MAISDWDIRLSNSTYTLNSGWFKSIPTSLRIFSYANSGIDGLLCKKPDTLCLPQGEMRTWVYREMNSGYGFYFRNQAALGTFDSINTYYLYRYGDTHRLVRREAGAITQIGLIGLSLNNGQAGHFRIQWWNGNKPTGQACLSFAFYHEDDLGNWVYDGILYDTVNQWKDSATNRCGLLYTGATNNSLFFEDTEIWKPV